MGAAVVVVVDVVVVDVVVVVVEKTYGPSPTLLALTQVGGLLL